MERLRRMKKELAAIKLLKCCPEQMKHMLEVYYEREISKLEREEQKDHGV